MKLHSRILFSLSSFLTICLIMSMILISPKVPIWTVFSNNDSLQVNKTANLFSNSSKPLIYSSNTTPAHSYYHNSPSLLHELPQEYKLGISDKLYSILSSLWRNFNMKVNLNDYKKRKVIFLITTWRSGSTFASEAMSSHPAIFYHYEPLERFKFRSLSTGNLTEEAILDLDNLSQCNYKNLTSYLDFARKDSSILLLNQKIKRYCEVLEDKCYYPVFLSRTCSMFPVQLIKLVRMRMSALEGFLSKKVHNNVDYHFILLVRDPRAILASRQKLSWCTRQKICYEPKALCSLMKQDLTTERKFSIRYPSRVHLLKYEDLVKNPSRTFQEIFSKLKIRWNSAVEDYLTSHTTKNVEEPWSRFRISKDRINLWKDELKSSSLKELNKYCLSIFRHLNYSMENGAF